MHRLKLTILGNGSAVPTATANPTSQLLTYDGDQFMFDCGEGTQMQLIKFRIKHRKLNNIFISHLHGDHFYGLIGLISTFNLFGRDKPLTVYAPADLEKLINVQLTASNTKLKFQLIFKHLEDVKTSLLIETDTFKICTFLLKHSVPTWGFVFREKILLRKISKEFVKNNTLSSVQIINIKQGSDFTDNNGVFYPNKEISNPPRKVLSYAYCSDTAYDESIIPHIKNADLLYHEATFDKSMEDVAADKMHSTAAQAALIAEKSNAKKLMLGHYSARFKDTSVLLNEAKYIFSNTILSIEGQTYLIGD